jgi:hypothetical protein
MPRAEHLVCAPHLQIGACDSGRMAAASRTQLANAIAAALAGDAGQLPVITSATQDELNDVTAGTELVLTRDAVASMLRRYRAGGFDGATVQAWASFVRRGYVALRSHGPIKPLTIDYEAAYEDAIVEAVGRLDEIGDLIDGTVDEAEIGVLLAALGEAS